MATTKEFHDYVLEQLSPLGDISTRRMMGEYCLYFHGKLVGDICDNRLLIKATETARRLLADCPLEYPYEGSKTRMYAVADLENRELLRELLEGVYAELPEKKR